MGGYGSGRQGGRLLAEEALRIDIAWMLRKGLAVEGAQKRGSLRWTCGGQPSGDVSYRCDMRDLENAELELRFTVTTRATDSAKSYIQRIRLTHTRPHLGGRRWWMHCPRNGSRVRMLFAPAGGEMFASRKAWGIAYRSQRQTKRDNLFERLFRLQRRLGCEEGWEMPIRRPKGMHYRTYARLEEQYWQLDAQCAVEMILALSRFGSFPSLEELS